MGWFIFGAGVGVCAVLLIIAIGCFVGWVEKVNDLLDNQKYFSHRSDIEYLEKSLVKRYELNMLDSSTSARYRKLEDRVQMLEMERIDCLNKNQKKPNSSKHP